jgi:hypothetical protein
MNNIDYEMELICKLYSHFNDEAKEKWSREEAEILIQDQIQYEAEKGIEHIYLDKDLVYEVIAELIEQDASEEEEYA